MANPVLRIEKLSQFSPQRINANGHTPFGMGMLDKAMSEDGYVSPMTAAASLEVIDGSARLEVSAEKFDEAIVIEHDGTRPLVAVRTDVPNAEDPRAKRISLRANRVAEVNLDWDPHVLQMLRDSDPEIVEEVFGADIEEILARARDEQTAEELQDVPPQLDKAEELRKKYGVETGQLWQLGEHKLLCGDSTKREDVERIMEGGKLRLVWTDPPYGVSYGAKNEFLNVVSPGNRIQTPIENDQLTEAQIEELCHKALTLACEFGLPGASFYVACPPGTPLPHFIAAVASSGFQFKHSLVWVKNQFVLGRCDYHYKHEIILYGWKEGPHLWVGDHSQNSVFEVDKPHVSDLHPTTKPVELIVPMVKNSSRQGEIIYDPFSGSGTSLVVSESLHRKCRAIEISPGYCAVTLERWSTLTNQQPQLLT